MDGKDSIGPILEIKRWSLRLLPVVMTSNRFADSPEEIGFLAVLEEFNRKHVGA